MRTLRCISRKITGQDEIALPTLFLGEWKDGEERPIEDDVAAILLGENPNYARSPFFEEVLPPAPAVKPATKADITKTSDPKPSADGGNA